MPSLKEFRSAYSGSMRFPMGDLGASMTQQQFRDECDINVLMARYQATGVLPSSINPSEGQFIDCEVQDFQSAMQLMAGASSLFNRLPSNIRNRFENDPAKLLSFLSDSSNRAEAVKLGLVTEGNVPPTPLQTTVAAAMSSTSGLAAGVPNPQGGPADPARAQQPVRQS